MQREKSKTTASNADKSAKPAKVDHSTVADQLMRDYDYKGEGSLDQQGLVDLLVDAFKLSNKKVRVNKDDFVTLFKMMDKDGDGRVTKKDLEAVVGKVLAKKEKEEEERLVMLKQREEQRERMKSPLRKVPEKSPDKGKNGAKNKLPFKSIEGIATGKDTSAKKAPEKVKEQPKDKSPKASKEVKEEKSTKKKEKKK